MMLNRLLRWLPAAAWMAVIFLLSHRTGSELNAMFPWVTRWFPWLGGFDFGHFVAYFVLAMCVWFAVGKSSIGAKLFVVLFCLIYGISDEFHQSFVPGRSPDPADLRNDAIGAAAAMIIISVPPVKRWLRRLGMA